ncbi:hypothetical protein GCM10023185_08700 [Hymenobacter saemangeumensis]|uniref:Lipoprotein n=1 Tax=Hymenobacter saemangeumensis TaxID=1084522 RepID=A0ABP8I443_9BACT
MAAASLALLAGCEQASEAKKSYNAIVTTTKAAESLSASMEEAQTHQAERVKRGDTLSINYKELHKLLPSAIEGYTAEGEPEGESVQMPGMQYSSTKQRYRKGEETLSVQLVDYNGAATMFTAATAMVGTGIAVEDETQLMRSLDLGMKGVKGYEKLDKQGHQASVLLGVADRFFVTLEATGQKDTELVKSAARQLKLSGLARM